MAAAGKAGNCPSCGAEAPTLLRHSKLAVCAYCNSTLFVEDAQVHSAGEKSVLAEVPSILEMGRRFTYGNWMFEPIGRIRYEYGESHGYWDEWWVLLSDGKTRWISNDEGEHVIQSSLEVEEPPVFENLNVGTQVRLGERVLHCTELNTGTCLGLQGQLPEVVRVGDRHRYAHLEGPDSALVTAEYDDAGSAVLYDGLWIDPFGIRSA